MKPSLKNNFSVPITLTHTTLLLCTSCTLPPDAAAAAITAGAPSKLQGHHALLISLYSVVWYAKPVQDVQYTWRKAWGEEHTHRSYNALQSDAEPERVCCVVCRACAAGPW